LHLRYFAPCRGEQIGKTIAIEITLIIKGIRSFMNVFVIYTVSIKDFSTRLKITIPENKTQMVTNAE
jgi:hypothetical protein